MKKRLEKFFENNVDTRIITIDIVVLFFVVIIINGIFFSLAWFLGLKEIFGNDPGARAWYIIIPFCLEIVLFAITNLWHFLGKKTIDTAFPDSWAYIIVGAFLYSTGYGILAYFYRSFSMAIFYLAGPLFLSTMYKSWKWVAATGGIVSVEALIIVSDVFEYDKYRVSDMPVGLDILFMADALFLVLSMGSSVYISRERADREAIRAEASNRAKSDFLATMSHEIRTPINAILGMNEMIIRTAEDNEVAGYAENIRNSGKTLLALINDILDFSKIEAGDLPIIPVDYNLGTLIFDCFHAVNMRAEEKGLKMILKVDEFLPTTLNGDEGRIRQIVTNLLTNAVKYTKEGNVTLKVKGVYRSEELFDLSFMVEDTGIGIAEEDMDQLFTAFKRFDEKKNRNIEGTGLGLAISERLATRMDGKISVMSEIGKGSVFTVSIPQKVVNRNPIGSIWLYNSGNGKRNETYKPKFTAPKAKVLCADDVPINLVVLTSMLKQTGVNITTAKDGLEAVEASQKERFDIILLDHQMPNMDGTEALAKIRDADANNPNIDTPVIILTANAIAGSKDEYLRQGFSDYLSKPIDGAALEQMLAQYLPPALLENCQGVCHGDN